MPRSFVAPALFFATALALLGCGGSATTIASARALSEQTQVTIEGYVTVPPGAFASAKSDQGFAAQDDSAGIYVSVATPVASAIGQKVRVVGKVSSANQLRILQADASAVTALDGTRTIAAKVVKTSEVNATSEGLLVRVAGRVTKPIADDSPYGYKLYLDDGSGEIQVFLHSSAGFDATKNAAYTPGSQLTVTGFAGRYDAEFEVDPRAVADLVPGT